MMFLHGTLEATIFNAESCNPSSSSSSSCSHFMCLCKRDNTAYVTIMLGGVKVAETSHEDDWKWNQTFRILSAHSADSTITIEVRTKMSVLGKVRFPASLLIDDGRGCKTYDELSFPLLTKKGKLNRDLKLRFNVGFRHAESEHSWGIGLANGGYKGVFDGVTFPPRSNCDVVLYQDAHHHRSFEPLVRLHGRKAYRPRRLWEDVYNAMNGAKHLIYIVGWSLNPKLVLVRDPNTDIQQARQVTIGELLKRKAEEGVAVRIMLWDDETSLPVIKNRGVMRTHDEDALEFFKHTKVVCKLCPRLHNDFPTFFAHHQKTVTIDAADEFDGGRALVSFIGGLDLCDGRYDTEDHSLFRTLNAESHAGDFYQINIAGAAFHRGGPREPWHDTHACVMGVAAHDILTNFEQRWSKQCDPSLLLPINTIPNLHCPSSLRGKNWSVQVFRSIDHVSAKCMPDSVPVEHSIHDAYVEAIRRAERFIYIENQYFMGGCHLWEKDRESGCKNLIPVEIALKVVSKIKAGERFAVYIVMPMWPEGVPESDPVQEMLHWTRLTIATMYRLIAEAIRGCGGSGAHPRDYLNFFCLANREAKRPGEYVPPDSPRRATHYWNAQRNRRFMIYVHSKLMIVDDEYLLIGSANVNQRSMDGKRDTEIEIGCHQPDYVGGRSRHGDIHAYRMSLWYEHTGRVDDMFLEPESVDCVRKLRRIGADMWRVYDEADVVDMGGVHLVNYPMNVSGDGSVGDLEDGGGVFPDTSALIRGRRSMIIPPVCTT